MTIFYATTVFLLSMVSIEMGYSHPVKYSTCEGKAMADGFVFNLHPSITKNALESDCELVLIIEGHNRAIYENGRVPVKVQPPVLSATMYNFTLATCPESMVLAMECLNTAAIPRTTCFCVNSTASPATSTTSVLTITAGIVTAAIFVIFITVLVICTLRKKTPLHGCVRKCVQGKSDHLQEEHNAMIGGGVHDNIT